MIMFFSQTNLSLGDTSEVQKIISEIQAKVGKSKKTDSVAFQKNGGRAQVFSNGGCAQVFSNGGCALVFSNGGCAQVFSNGGCAQVFLKAGVPSFFQT